MLYDKGYDDLYIAFFDGACEPRNPGGNMGWGIVVYKGHDLIHKGWGYHPKHKENSNNVAEYCALLMALQWFLENDKQNERILLKGDSRLVIEQMFGHWRIKHGMYASYAKQAKEWLQDFNNCRGVWIPRTKNKLADIQSKIGFKLEKKKKGKR